MFSIILFCSTALGSSVAVAEVATASSDQAIQVSLAGHIENPNIKELIWGEYLKYFSTEFDQASSQNFARFITVFIGDEFVKNGQLVAIDGVKWNQSQIDLFKELSAIRAFPEEGCQHRRMYFASGDFGILVVDASENPDVETIRRCFVVGMLSAVWAEPKEYMIGDFENARHELEKRVSLARLHAQ